ncbi:hypothetical protein SANTM175S_07870 [Streptomyces antimycoticus]
MLLICGVLTYVGVLDEMGTIDLHGRQRTWDSAARRLLLCYIGATVSAFASSVGIMGALIPLAVPFLARRGGDDRGPRGVGDRRRRRPSRPTGRWCWPTRRMWTGPVLPAVDGLRRDHGGRGAPVVWLALVVPGLAGPTEPRLSPRPAVRPNGSVSAAPAVPPTGPADGPSPPVQPTGPPRWFARAAAEPRRGDAERAVGEPHLDRGTSPSPAGGLVPQPPGPHPQGDPQWPAIAHREKRYSDSWGAAPGPATTRPRRLSGPGFRPRCTRMEGAAHERRGGVRRWCRPGRPPRRRAAPPGSAAMPRPGAPAPAPSRAPAR